MKRFYPLLLILASSLTLSNCGATPFCSGDTKNVGEIKENFKIPECFRPKEGTQEQFIVRSLDDLDTVNCNLTQVPVDFQQFSILGKSVSGGCKLRVITREVQINHQAKKYTYTIKFKDCGLCKSLGTIFNAVLVPSIPQDYDVVFDVIEK